MNPLILEILQKLSDDSYSPGEEATPDLWESAKTVSYKTMKQVQECSDENLLPELIQAFTKNQRNENAANILFIITSIVMNSNNASGLDFMHNLLTTSKNKKILTHTLAFYASKVKLPAKYSIAPLLTHFADKSKQIRIYSYRAVGNSLHDNKETLLLEKLNSLENLHEIEEILQTLSGFSGNDTLLVLEEYLKNKSSRVRQAAKLCKASISVRNGAAIESQLTNIPLLQRELLKQQNRNI